MAILIGVHGLDNKPSPDELEHSWRSALREGLAGLPQFREELPLEMHYWADLYYPAPLPEEPEPYTPSPSAASPPAPGPTSKERLANLPAEELGARYPDLVRYFREPLLSRNTREGLRLHLESHRGGKLLLICHSMGCVIAHDVLQELDPDRVWVELATFGCPLGFPQLWQRMQLEHGKLRVPAVLRSWTNYVDLRDPVATIGFQEIFPSSSRGVEIVDEVVHNDYRSPSGKDNPHKVYGYLRSSEFSRRTLRFLSQRSADPAASDRP